MQMIAKNWQSKFLLMWLLTFFKFLLMVFMAAYILYQSYVRKLESGGASAMTHLTREGCKWQQSQWGSQAILSLQRCGILLQWELGGEQEWRSWRCPGR